MLKIADDENSVQPVFPFQNDADSLRICLCTAAGRDISLTVTDNSTSMVFVRTKGAAVSVRLHRMFLSAGDDVIGELADFIRRGRGRTPLIRDYIRRNRRLLRKSPTRRTVFKTEGRYHDLAGIYREINGRYFEGRVSAGITWGVKNRRRYARKRTLGSYSGHTDTIRINTILDRKSVPSYFIGFVVYHEMLHADMGTGGGNKRRSVHPAEFRVRECLYHDYEKALAWERKLYIM